jgi:hypothetical protein
LRCNLVSGFGIENPFNDFDVSCRLQQHFTFVFSHSTFDVGRSMFDVRSLVSYSIKLAVPAAKGLG